MMIKSSNYLENLLPSDPFKNNFVYSLAWPAAMAGIVTGYMYIHMYYICTYYFLKNFFKYDISQGYIIACKFACLTNFKD
jgi:hypothetical protein